MQSYGYTIIEKTKLSEMLAKSGKITNQIFLKVSFAVSEIMPTFAVRWSGSLREMPSVAPAYSNNTRVLVEAVFLSMCLYAGGVPRKWSLPFPFLSLAFARCFCSIV